SAFEVLLAETSHTTSRFPCWELNVAEPRDSIGMPSLNRKVLTSVLLIVSISSAGRLVLFYSEGYRAKKAKAAEDAERRRRADEYVNGLLLRQDAAAPIRDGQFSCVFVSLQDSSPVPRLGKCAAPGERSDAVDRFEIDLRYGNLRVRQTDLSLNDI